MTAFSPLASVPAKLPHGAELLQRKPQRVTTSLNWQLHQRLQAQAEEQGRPQRLDRVSTGAIGGLIY